MVASAFLFALVSVRGILATPLIYDGRTPFNYTKANLNGSVDLFLTTLHFSGLKHLQPLFGTDECSLFSRFLPSLLSNLFLCRLTIALSSFQAVTLNLDFDARMLSRKRTGVTVFHFSIRMDETRPLNYNHEYQIVFIEPNDGSHVLGIQLGSPFANPTGKLPAKNACNFKVLDHALNVLFSTPFTPTSWHNFAVQVDWEKNTLAVRYSQDSSPLKAVTKVVSNPTHPTGAAGQGDFHFGVLKLPLVNPRDSPTDQGDVVHHGIQEGATEGLLYSGVFVEGVQNGISVGGGHTTQTVGK